MVNTIGFHFSPNKGKLLENLIFLHLRRKSKEIYYLTTQNSFEIDFYLPETRTMIQVTQNMSNPTTREREIRAILDAIQTVDTQHVLILSEDNEDPIRIGDKEIQIQSISEWLQQENG